MNKKKFTRLLILTLFSCLIFIGFFINKIRIKNDKQVILLTEKSKKGRTLVKSNLKTPYKMVVTLEGTFNDTIIFDAKKLPPSEINKTIYDYDWYADSAWFYFDTYKATKVNLNATFKFYQ